MDSSQENFKQKEIDFSNAIASVYTKIFEADKKTNAEFLNLAKGIEYNICDADYGTKLATIAKDVIGKVGKFMYLSRPPVVDTIVVTYGSQVIPNDVKTGWTYDTVRNALAFGEELKYSAQPAGTQLEVNFTAGTY